MHNLNLFVLKKNYIIQFKNKT